jgi:NADPH-dependent 2,4-dienoyl-CoA reductase/sulfur reductase-like enzyme
MARDPFVVIGGDAAGLSAASKFRRETDRDVIVFEQGQWISYAHCGTPYFVEGSVDRLTDLLSLSPAETDARGIDLYRGHEVESSPSAPTANGSNSRTPSCSSRRARAQ